MHQCGAEGFAGATTTARLATEAAALAGFVAAEGCFTGTPGSSMQFAVGLGASDEASVRWLARFFGVGRVHHYPRRKPHYDDEVVFVVRRLRDLVEVIVPFMDEHLPPCHKRTQYDAWRAELMDYWNTTARRARPCAIEGCGRPQRAKGLCRRHYYAAYGR